MMNESKPRFISNEKIKTALLLFLVLFIGFYNLSKTNDLKYVDEKAKSVTSDAQLQKELIETNKKYYRDESGQTYLIGPDPYLYYRIARNLLELGTINDSVKPQVVLKNNSYVEEYLQSDSLRFAPTGTVMQKELMPYAIYYFHRVWNVFSTAALSKTAFYLPVFLGLISVMAVFFLVLIATKNDFAAFFSSFLLAMNPTFVAFNFGGYTDTHIIAMMFSLTTMLFFISIFKLKNVWIKIISAILTALSLYILKFSWRGWFFVLALMGGYVIFEMFKIFKKNFTEGSKKNILKIAMAIFIIATFAFILYQNNAIQSALDRLIVPQNAKEFMPSSFGTVDELQSLSFSVLANYFGGVLIIIFILVASLNIFRKQNRNEPFNWFVLVWFLFFVVIGKFSMRFLFFSTPPSAILLGLLCRDAIEHFKKQKARLITSTSLILLFLLILYPTIQEVWQNGPMMNDAIEETGLFLQQNSAKNSVLNVWWDAGYYWQTFTRRGTTMDGGLFETQIPFYFANAAVTNNSELSRQINSLTGCGLSKIPAKKDFENRTIEEALTNYTSAANFSKCKNDVYLVIDERTLLMTPTFYPYTQKQRAELQEPMKSLLEKGKFFLGGFTAKDLPYISPIINCENGNNNIIKCENHLVDTQKIAFKGTPLNSLIVVKDGVRNEKYYNPELTNVSLIVFREEGNRFRAVLIDKKIKDAINVRLFSGEKIDGFENVHTTSLPIRIVTYKINAFNFSTHSSTNQS